MITLSSSELFSHPDKTLREHLHNVSGIGLSGLRKESPDFSSIGLDGDILEMLVRLITLSHDFGKSTKYFQDYLEKSIKTGKKDHSNLTNHGLISAGENLKNMTSVTKILPVWLSISHMKP